jgi:MinD-like ATPase involved in chromosome partitioning or flagellar assembly
LYVITFYSFKGGVGRTMALVNVAAELVRRGRNVLVVDFDLEAPGLETYKRLQPPQPHPGIVEYVTEYRETNAVPNLLDYVYETKPIGKRGGRLWVMPAGRRDSGYRRSLAKLDWQELYTKEEGFLLFEDTKAGWEKELKPDYVLIDSRTGDTDVLGICTRQLPHSVVIMFTPNEQNLVGLEHVCHAIRREESEGLKKPIRIHFVAANVPDLDDENRVLSRHLKAFQDRLRFEKLAATFWRFEDLRLLDQRVVVLDRPRSKLARSYKRLIPTLIVDNLAGRDGALVYLNKLAGGRHESGVNLFPRAASLNSIATAFMDDPDILFGVALCRVEGAEFEAGRKTLDRVLKLRPNFGEARVLRAKCSAWLNQREAAATDLVDSLRNPPLDAATGAIEPQTVIRAFRELRVLSPTQTIQAAHLPALAVCPVPIRVEIAEIIGETDEGLAVALEILAQCVLEEKQQNKLRGYSLAVHRYSAFLIRARQWRKAMAVLNEWCTVSSSPPDFLLLRAFAAWGESGHLSQAECKRILDSFAGPDFSAEDDFWDDPQLYAWLLWGAGNPTEAIKVLDAVLAPREGDGSNGLGTD